MRGQKQAAEKQLKLTNQVAEGRGRKANKLEEALIPGYTSLMNTGFVSPEDAEMNQSLIGSGYLSPEDAAAATTSEMGAATAPFDTAGFEARNRAAATRNPAGVAEQEDALALSKGRTAGEAAARLQREKMSNQLSGLSMKTGGQQFGMYGLNTLEGANLRAMEEMYGLGPGTLGARAAGGGWSQGFHDVASGIGSVLNPLSKMGQSDG